MVRSRVNVKVHKVKIVIAYSKLKRSNFLSLNKFVMALFSSKVKFSLVDRKLDACQS